MKSIRAHHTEPAALRSLAQAGATLIALMNHEWILPAGLPAGLTAVMTTRSGGASLGAYASMNLGDHVGDDPYAVQENRQRLAQALGSDATYLRQVHGTRVHVLSGDGRAVQDDLLEGDASISLHPGRACAVLVADCLPVLLATQRGDAVAAAHAGWRGLAAGVLARTVSTLCERSACEPASLWAWLGPCIGAQSFEVGEEVRQAFAEGDHDPRVVAACFKPGPRAPRWMADLQGLAQGQLHHLGVQCVHVEQACTVLDSRFFSFRRDGVSGRMAAAIVIRSR